MGFDWSFVKNSGCYEAMQATERRQWFKKNPCIEEKNWVFRLFYPAFVQFIDKNGATHPGSKLSAATQSSPETNYSDCSSHLSFDQHMICS